MKRIIKCLLALFLVLSFSSCISRITDGKGVVVSVRQNDTDDFFPEKKYMVKVRIEKDEVTYFLYTDQVYTIGDVIQFKR